MKKLGFGVILIMLISLAGCFSEKEKIKLVGISIKGSAVVESGMTTTYDAIEVYSDNTIKKAAGIWSATGSGKIDQTGVFTAAEDGDAVVTLSKDGVSGNIKIKVLKEIPNELRGETWKNHFVNDILPFWTMEEAKGNPLGNFATYRQMNGKNVDGTKSIDIVYPRMLSRQIYTYSMGYLLTGDEELLKLAKEGVDWMITKAIDKEKGGFYPILTSQGAIITEQHLISFGVPKQIYEKFYLKSSQDTAYCNLGFAAYYFVTRDKEVEKYLLETKDMIFNPKYFWDATKNTVKDAMSVDMTKEIDQEGGGAELVAVLDQINAYMLLVQPVLSEKSRRDEFLNDMKRLSDTMIKEFYKDGVFWGQKDNIGKYGTRHVDFGHTLKSYWMLNELDKRIAGHPYKAFVNENAPQMITLAFDSQYGRWGKAMTGKTTASYGCDWWIYAEADQFAASINMGNYTYIDMLKNTSGNWMNDFVDKTYKEVYPGINRDGTKAYNWTVSDTAKQNEWKNGFHTTEHSVVMYITGKALEGKNAELYFAIPESEENTFEAKPYIYHGEITGREKLGNIEIDSRKLSKVKVSFRNIQ